MTYFARVALLAALVAPPMSVVVLAHEADEKALAQAADFKPYAGKVKGESVRLRTGAGTNHPPIYVFEKDEEVVVVGVKDNWAEVRLPKNAPCWISAEFVTLSADGKSYTVKGEKVNLRGSADTTSFPIGQVRKGATLVAVIDGQSGKAIATETYVRVIAPAERELLAEKDEQERLAGVLARHVGDQRAQAIVTGERARQRRVTVLTANVANFLPLLQRQPPAATLHLLDELYATTTRVVHAHGGHVEKMLGDTVQCVWGIAGESADDERRAVAAGLALQREVAVLAAARKERGDQPFAVGVGVATGDAVVGTVGGSARAESVVVGEVTALADALEREARAHNFGMLISEETFAKVADAYEGAASPPILVDGIGVPLTFYRVRPRSQPSAARLETTAPVRRAPGPSDP